MPKQNDTMNIHYWWYDNSTRRRYGVFFHYRQILELGIYWSVNKKLNIFQGLLHFMPVLSADLLWATKLPQPDSQNRIFTSVLAAVCASVLLCVCVCVSVHVHIQKPNLPSVWPKSKNKKEKKIFRVETFFCVTQMSQMKMRWHKPSIKFCSLTFSEFCIAKPAISPANGVACWCVDVAITGNRRDHCTKACTSFPSPRIRADQHETSSSALSASAWGREKKMRSLLGNFLK